MLDFKVIFAFYNGDFLAFYIIYFYEGSGFKTGYEAFYCLGLALNFH